jgi:NADPH-dependent curcumin reductase CurA
MTETNRQVQMAARPNGFPKDSDFQIAESPVPVPGDGEVLVKNIYMSVDPYMRGRMNDFRGSYIPPFEIAGPMSGGAVGQVVASNHDGYAVGDYVLNMGGWSEYVVRPGRPLHDGADLNKIDPSLAPLSAFLGGIGMPGLTAYAGLMEVGIPKEGETVYISAASGAVGAVAGQIAKIKGCRVVGSAGSDEKVAYLTDEIGFDAAFNYKTIDLNEALAETCPNGIDVNFENVGGAMLEAVLHKMNQHGRIIFCGSISGYNDTTPAPGPNNLTMMIMREITLRGYIVTSYMHLMPDFYRDMGAWLKSGQMTFKETVVDGIENAPSAFMGMLRGENMGKMIVKLADDPTQ